MDSNECVERTGKMWLELAEQIAAAVPDQVSAGEPLTAIRWAMCADACFFQATGEGPGKSVEELLKELVPPPPLATAL